ncbi:phosphomannomutase [Franconibacter pulveris 1160]|uniref:phosphomannomutase n=1 Tax=Franconibacter pulveris TaxID=435910 RepID=UPI000465FF5F|nr:phosphomannomutase [Franconibacter pulveris]
MLNTKEVIQYSGVAFGTSGARGLVSDFTSNVCAAFASAFISAIKPKFEFTQVAIAIDNRPSSIEMARACSAALVNMGIRPIYFGVIPTPALAYYCIKKRIPGIMVTGSHIPFDRNGLKFYRPDGEITKADEERILQQSLNIEPLNVLPLLNADSSASTEYIERYLSMFDSNFLKGKRVGIYEHSSAGRDLYRVIFEKLGAEVFSLDRTNEFVPIDTEAVSEEDQKKAHDWTVEYQLDLIFSTDGDGDRPLVADEKGRWLRGDILGLLCADALHIEALAVPVSCNTAIEHCGKFKKVERTRIGSPYVIAAFDTLNQNYQRIAGFEANGGFILGSDLRVDGQMLYALPTRDAVLPALMLLKATGLQPVSTLINALPERYTFSERIKDFPTERSKEILKKGASEPDCLLSAIGLGGLTAARIDLTDGLRIVLTNGDIIHFRPSGNAPELRCYAEASEAALARYYVFTGLNGITSVMAK